MEALQNYRIGQRPKNGKNWDEVSVVYGPVLINDNHWVEIALHIKERMIKVYDSLAPKHSATSSIMHEEINQIRKILSALLATGSWDAKFDHPTARQDPNG
ncbi:hypothetical protein MKW98_014550 [Papaver atlanticum]|uniref:Ubiquitin-like protease family profile domain-containing protein n=1 Tax=Papaver atlanticum TaxID=357466 RepID=A0AAD4RZ04_9MAGN|nr:hypothetical protein MKW98_014550 [Papaver atlanticum]